MKAAALLIAASVSTSSITATRADMYRALVDAVQLAEHLDVELMDCRDELVSAPAPVEVVEQMPGWVWPAAAGAALVSFGLGFWLASQGPALQLEPQQQ